MFRFPLLLSKITRTLSAILVSMDNYSNLWQCSVCLAKFVVPSLARECESRHNSDSS